MVLSRQVIHGQVREARLIGIQRVRVIKVGMIKLPRNRRVTSKHYIGGLKGFRVKSAGIWWVKGCHSNRCEELMTTDLE